MNRDACGFSLSFFLHASILSTFLYVFPALDLQSKPLVIDFSLIPGGSSQNAAAVPKPEQPAKPPPLLQVPPKPKQLSRPKAIERVLPKVPPKSVIAKKLPARPVEKILPREEEKVVQEEVLPEAAEINRPTEPFVASHVVQPQLSSTEANSAEPVGGSVEALSSHAIEQQYVKAHFIYIKKIIEKNINYPSMARRMGWQGKVVVSFVVCKNGKVENLQVVESSGHAPLDKNALETVRQVEPFPNPPIRVKLVLPVTYTIS